MTVDMAAGRSLEQKQTTENSLTDHIDNKGSKPIITALGNKALGEAETSVCT
jgi:hypothetical protein